MKIRLFLLFAFAVFSTCIAESSWGEEIKGLVYEEYGNIMLERNGEKRRLTGAERDSEPVLSPNGRWIAFNREIEGAVEKCELAVHLDCPSDQLWLIDLENDSEELLLEPRADARDVKKVIYNFKGKAFSPDSQTVYFFTTAYAVSDAIHSVDIKEKKDRYVTHGNSLQVVRGPLPPEIKKYLTETLKEDDWRIYPKEKAAILIQKALKDEVEGYLIAGSSGVKVIHSQSPLENGWKGDDGMHYASRGRRWWPKLTSPDGKISIPIGKEEW